MLEHGKITDAIYQRSVKKILGGWPVKQGLGFEVNRSGSLFEIDNGPSVRTAAAVAAGQSSHDAALGVQTAMAVHESVNRLAAAGGEPWGVMIQILAPAGMEESALKEITRTAAAACAGLQIAAGQSDVTAIAGIEQPVVTATAIGDARGIFTEETAVPGQDILMAGYAGWSGSVELAAGHYALLEKRYHSGFLEGLMRRPEDASDFSALAAVRAAASAGACTMYAAGEGGIFSALWELAERNGLGLRVQLKDILLRQETVEVSDYFGVSPYQLYSAGCLVMTADHGRKVQGELAAAGIPAAVIGYMMDDNSRVIMNEDETRYLEPFRGDSLSAVQINMGI